MSDFDPSPCPTDTYEKVIELEAYRGLEEENKDEEAKKPVPVPVPVPSIKIPNKLQESYDLADDIAL